MKKILLLLLSVVLVFSLVACVGKDDEKTPSNDNKTTSSTQNDDFILSRDDVTSSEDDEIEKNNGEETDPVTKVLNEAGLDLEAITPAEATFDYTFDEGSSTFTFYMELDTETNTAAYLNKIVEACKSVADDEKLYEANFGFALGNRTELSKLPDADKISNTTYLYSFCYLIDGEAIGVSISRFTEKNKERGDAVSYPTYSIALDKMDL